jgi:DNA-binding protein YbaB
MAIFSKLKQFKDLRDQAKTIQNALAEETVHADAAGGKLQLIMDGNTQVNGLSIDPEFLNPAKKDQLERELKGLINNGVKKAQMVMAKKAREMGNLNLPGMS